MSSPSLSIRTIRRRSLHLHLTGEKAKLREEVFKIRMRFQVCLTSECKLLYYIMLFCKMQYARKDFSASETAHQSASGPSSNPQNGIFIPITLQKPAASIFPLLPQLNTAWEGGRGRWKYNERQKKHWYGIKDVGLLLKIDLRCMNGISKRLDWN